MQRLDTALAYLSRVLAVAVRALPSDDGGDLTRRGIEDTFTSELDQALSVGLAVVVADPTPAALDEVDAALAGALTPVVTRMLEQAALSGVAQAQMELGGIVVDWGLVNRDALTWARDYAGELVRGLNATTRDALRREIAAWIESGEPLDVLARRLAPMFGELRGRVIAETEVTRAFAEGQYQAFQRAGVARWTWHTANDERVCDICQPRDGEMYPMEAERPPAHVRCRCWMTAAT